MKVKKLKMFDNIALLLIFTNNNFLVVYLHLFYIYLIDYWEYNKMKIYSQIKTRTKAAI